MYNKYILKRTMKYKLNDSSKSKKLHLGCGDNYLTGWTNIDRDINIKLDIALDFKYVRDFFKNNSIQEVMMIHSISYLRLWETRDFFKDIYIILKKSGKLILEFPDLEKCAKKILESNGNVEEYLEGVRGVYAFDLNQIKNKELFDTYAFGWSAWHIKYELEYAGFSKILVKEPETHNQMSWRDTRIEAIK